MPSDGYNWFLILVAIIASVVLVLINVYILVHLQHPEDRNQAWFPKLVVVRALNPRRRERDLRPTADRRPPPPPFVPTRVRFHLIVKLEVATR